jgi:hypothetical protein
MLEWNRAKVKNLTGFEVWLMIVGRVLVGFGFGISAVRWITDIANPLGVPVKFLGLACSSLRPKVCSDEIGELLESCVSLENKKISAVESIGLVGRWGSNCYLTLLSPAFSRCYPLPAQ